ncbi:hypothetical protein [Flavobacterium psychrotrophum]|uniref:hypothetical protein n=1 Tax=Flavobacterium psychrotrophum TaxID=2294119 RepID=UPI000E3218F9|nr:hypothetical protein [Flavobacterium psychrotrophum]
MKLNRKYIRTAFFSALVFGALSFSSCKNKTDEGDDAGTDDMVTDTIPPEGMSSVPGGDTIVKDNDTVVKMGPKNDLKENPVGEQVP